MFAKTHTIKTIFGVLSLNTLFMNQKILWDYGGNRKIWPPRAFTLVEIMVVIAIIGILGTALFPSLSGYIVRTRDTSRIADITDIAFSLETYRQEYEKYPPHEAGCYPYTSLSGVFLTRKLESPSGSGYDEGCGSSGKYGYGISTGETINILMARMENPYGGNYVSSGELLLGLTGTLTSLGLANTLYYTKRSTGSTYVFPSAAGDIILSAGGTPPAPSDGVCSAASA